MLNCHVNKVERDESQCVSFETDELKVSLTKPQFVPLTLPAMLEG